MTMKLHDAQGNLIKNPDCIDVPIDEAIKTTKPKLFFDLRRKFLKFLPFTIVSWNDSFIAKKL